MKHLCSSLFFLCFVSISGLAFQNDGKIDPPKTDDVEKIETTDNTFRFYTPASLLRILPRLAPATHGTAKPPGYQYGTITLKNGTILKWKSSHFGNVILYNDDGEQFYVEQEPFLDIGPLTYTFVSIAAFGLLFFVFLDQRHRSIHDPTPAPESVRKNYWKMLLLRITAFAFFVLLSYLTLRTPLQRINDGVFLASPGRFDTRSVMVFADTDPKTFWLHVGGGFVVAILPLLFGLFFLIFNPRSSFWTRKSRPASQMDELS